MNQPKGSTTVVSVYFPQIHEFSAWSPSFLREWCLEMGPSGTNEDLMRSCVSMAPAPLGLHRKDTCELGLRCEDSSVTYEQECSSQKLW